MSWPKAFIKKDGEEARRGSVWGCYMRGNVIAVEFRDHERGVYSEIVSIDDVIQINWECAHKFPELMNVDTIQTFFFDGYGADEKKKLFEKAKKEIK